MRALTAEDVPLLRRWTVAPEELPSWAGALRLSGVRAFDRPWNVELSEGRVRVEEAVSHVGP